MDWFSAPSLAVLTVAGLAVFLIAFMRGAFGGGFALLGIPVMSLAMDPITAGGVLAPLFLVMDAVALRYWRADTWSKPEVVILAPAIVIGVGVGYWLLDRLPSGLVSVLIALLTLSFAAYWFIGGGRIDPRPRSTPKALLAGTASGVTSMVAHSGGPPLAMYLLPLGLSKQVYAGTTSITFVFCNAAKAGPWLLVAKPTAATWSLVGLCVPLVPLGIWAGWRLHQVLDQTKLYRICYGLLIVTALHLLWTGVRAW